MQTSDLNDDQCCFNRQPELYHGDMREGLLEALKDFITDLKLLIKEDI